MLDWLPGPLHRTLLRVAHKLRVRVWRALRMEVRGCNTLAFDPSGRLLLVRHSYQQAERWMLPGGGLGRNESPAAAGAREVAEETGCRLAGAVWFGTDIVQHDGWRNRLELVTGVTSDVPRADGRELEEARFFALDALPETVGGAVHRRLAQWQAWRANHDRESASSL